MRVLFCFVWCLCVNSTWCQRLLMLKFSLHFFQPSMVPYAYSPSHQETEAARLHLRPVWVGVEIKGKKIKVILYFPFIFFVK